MPNTRSPAAKRVTPGPVRSTMPATSHPIVNGGSPTNPPLSRVFQSTGLTPAAVTRTSTSVGAGSGSDTSTSSSTSGPPSARCRIARIVGGGGGVPVSAGEAVMCRVAANDDVVYTGGRPTEEDHGQSRADELRLPEPVRGRDPAGLRGVGGDVPVPRALPRGEAGGGREPVLVLELDALPRAHAGLRRALRRQPVPDPRCLAEPGLRGAARDGDRLPHRQRLRLHLRQPRHRPGEDRRAGSVLPAAGGLRLR